MPIVKYECREMAPKCHGLTYYRAVLNYKIRGGCGWREEMEKNPLPQCVFVLTTGSKRVTFTIPCRYWTALNRDGSGPAGEPVKTGIGRCIPGVPEKNAPA